MNIMTLTRALERFIHNARESTILHVDVIDVVCIIQTIEQDAIFTLLASHILHVHVANGWIESTRSVFFRVVVQVDTQNSLLALSHFYVTHVNVLRNTTSTRIALNTQYTVEIGRIHFAILYEYVIATTSNLRTNYHASMTVFHHAIAHDDVLAWDIPFTSVSISTTLDGNTIVSRMEFTTFYQYVFA